MFYYYFILLTNINNREVLEKHTCILYLNENPYQFISTKTYSVTRTRIKIKNYPVLIISTIKTMVKH